MKKPPTMDTKYVKLLEFDMAQALERIKELRRDLEFYRGKCERLELAIAQTSPNAALANYALRAEPPRPQPQGVPGGLQQINRRPAFSELKRRWAELSAEQQEKVIDEGSWDVDGISKEATNAGE